MNRGREPEWLSLLFPPSIGIGARLLFAKSVRSLSLTVVEQEPYPNFFLYRRLVHAKLFIDSHFSEKINVDNIADEAYCSKFHFIRLFNKIYGKTPHQYLTQIRIEQAKRLLKKDIPVADACFSVGFESISSFKALFKKRVGVTPTAYRDQHRALTEAILKQPTRYIPGCFVEKSGLVAE